VRDGQHVDREVLWRPALSGGRLGAAAADPRAFAAAWAKERGVGRPIWRERIGSRRNALAIALLVLVAVGGIVAAIVASSAGTRHATATAAHPTRTVIAARSRVPDLVGLNRDEARARARVTGFAVAVHSIRSSGIPALMVVDQSPAGGAVLSPGGVLVLVVAAPSHH